MGRNYRGLDVISQVWVKMSKRWMGMIRDGLGKYGLMAAQDEVNENFSGINKN